ncbi:MAG: hypothetical protein VKL39_05390 [Leptolyngbyaceae bacterium]|nr:hypothetical protein [Leptolyngbyaceae bacterium]
MYKPKLLSHVIVSLALLAPAFLGCSTTSVSEPPQQDTAPVFVEEELISSPEQPLAQPESATQTDVEQANAEQADVEQADVEQADQIDEGAIAQAITARCVIKGGSDEIRFDGECLFGQFGGNGSFFIEAPSGLIDGYMSISVAIIEPGIAEVRGLTTDGINSRWGEAQRSRSDAACWVGSDFTICAY